MSGHGHEIKPTVTMCCWIWAALMALLVLTYVVGMYVDAGAGNFAIAFAIAMTKATIIILFFMHIYYSSPLVRMWAGSGFFFLLILIGLTLCDVRTRDLHYETDVPEYPAPAEDAPARHEGDPSGNPMPAHGK